MRLVTGRSGAGKSWKMDLQPSFLCSHCWAALKQGTNSCNHVTWAVVYQAAVVNVRNTDQTGKREHTCWVDYWLNELRPNRQIWSAFSRLLLINWGGGSCWWIANKTSLLFCYGCAWLLTRAVDLFSEFNCGSFKCCSLEWKTITLRSVSASSVITSCEVCNKDGIQAFSPQLSLFNPVVFLSPSLIPTMPPS